MDKITLPEPDVPMIDPRTGKLTEAWYVKLQQLVSTLNALIP
jgi:hypothetical protein